MAEDVFWYFSAMRTQGNSLLAQASLHHPVRKAADAGIKADAMTTSITSPLFFNSLWLQILNLT